MVFFIKALFLLNLIDSPNPIMNEPVQNFWTYVN